MAQASKKQRAKDGGDITPVPIYTARNVHSESWRENALRWSHARATCSLLWPRNNLAYTLVTRHLMGVNGNGFGGPWFIMMRTNYLL